MFWMRRGGSTRAAPRFDRGASFKNSKNVRQRQGLRLILFPQTVPKSLGSVSLAASGSFLSEAGPFPSAAP
jgi:hypothetical protein